MFSFKFLSIKLLTIKLNFAWFCE